MNVFVGLFSFLPSSHFSGQRSQKDGVNRTRIEWPFIILFYAVQKRGTMFMVVSGFLFSFISTLKTTEIVAMGFSSCPPVCFPLLFLKSASLVGCGPPLSITQFIKINVVYSAEHVCCIPPLLPPHCLTKILFSVHTNPLS